jgi:hypothetical protein
LKDYLTSKMPYDCSIFFTEFLILFFVSKRVKGCSQNLA